MAISGVRTERRERQSVGRRSAEPSLAGTGFTAHRDDGVDRRVRDGRRTARTICGPSISPLARRAQAASGAALETVTVTSSKIGGDVQNIPISITALSQEQLTATQTAGGPDLVKQVPNLTFTKTNFSGYSIQIRGIGTQAISVTTDPAVAVAFNDIPFIRNHFFEQEFYDVSQVEVLRGPQGTLYGRNATAGVVNLVSAKPTDQFEAMASLDIGNYGNRRLEGMINIPIVDDRLDLRVAGEWTKRQGYSFNELTDQPHRWPRSVVGPRVASAGSRSQTLQTNLVWEHFSEDDDRMRTASSFARPRRFRRQSTACLFRRIGYRTVAGLSIAGAIISARAACRRRSIRRMRSKCRTGIRCPIIAAGIDGPAISMRRSIPMPARRNRAICA